MNDLELCALRAVIEIKEVLKDSKLSYELEPDKDENSNLYGWIEALEWVLTVKGCL